MCWLPEGSVTRSKAIRVDGIPDELLQILNNAVKMLHSICQQPWKTQLGYRTGKGQFSFQSRRSLIYKKVYGFCHSVKNIWGLLCDSHNE